jgi:sensor histidine kinase regulating citrate/malate metabolism
VDQRIAAFQMDLITRHYGEVQNMYRQMRAWRHDYHSHIQTMKVYLAMKRWDEMEEYLSHLDNDLVEVDTVLKSGNVMVDAILNSKLSLAKSRQIHIHAKATVPEKLNLSEVDLCVILGNLLDNAMEACEKVKDPDERFIRVYIGVKKNQLYLSVTNSAGPINRHGDRFLTTKGEGHGFGLMRIDRIAGKYKGYVNRQQEEGAFTTEILLPL